MSKAWHSGHTLSDHVDPTHAQWARPLQDRIEMLGDFDYRSVLGADTNLDQVKFTTYQPHDCSCKITYIWHRDSHEDDRIHHPLIQHNVCDTHAAHKGDVHAHFKALVGFPGP